MRNLRFAVARTGFSLLFLGLTLLQLFSFPGQFRNLRKTEGLSLFLEIALTLLFGLWLLCGQVALIYLWKIVQSMKQGMFYSVRSLHLIKRLVMVFKLASVIPVILFLLLVPQAEDPGFFVLLSIVILFMFSLTAMVSLLHEQISSKITNQF